MFYVKLSRPNLREGKSILADTAQHRNKRAINILGLENRKKKKKVNYQGTGLSPKEANKTRCNFRTAPNQQMEGPLWNTAILQQGKEAIRHL